MAEGITEVFLQTNYDKTTSNQIDQIFDREWVKSTFNINDADIQLGDTYKKWLRVNRYFSSADFKFTSTSPGMSIAVNPKPQFTRYCDIRSKGRLRTRPTVTLNTTSHPLSLGMGRYYSEAIDDNEQRVFFRFGVPKYAPLPIWLAKSFDIDRAILQNRGIITSTLLEVIGMVSTFFAVISAPLLALGMYLGGVLVENSRLYYIKDTMYLYWATVEDILNSLVARRTLLPTIFTDYTYLLNKPIGSEQRINASFLQDLNSYIPDIINAQTGRISVYAIALRAQRAYNKMLHDDYVANEQNQNVATDFTGYQYKGESSHDTYFTNNRSEPTLFVKYLFEKAYEFLIGKDDKVDAAIQSPVDQTTNTPNDTLSIEIDDLYKDSEGNVIQLSPPTNGRSNVNIDVKKNIENNKRKDERYKEYILAEMTEGGAFAVFNVEYTGSVGESFSNSTTDNPLENTFNSISSGVRQFSPFLNAASEIPIVGDVLKFAADAGAKILSSSTFGLANPLLALAYGVNISMPKIWSDSSASFPRASYKLKLISPYGNAYSQLFNIYLPLSMILAGSLPRSTGSSTYTSPFLCEVFDRGRVNIKLGMIDSVTITRGTSNLAFTKSGHANAIDVDFSVTSLDEIMTVDVNSNGFLLSALKQLSPATQDTPFNSYLNTVAGLDVYTQVYRLPSLRLALAERYMKFSSIMPGENADPAGFGMFTVNAVPLVGEFAKFVLGRNAALVTDMFNR